MRLPARAERLLAVGWILAIVTADAITGPDVVLVGLLILAPLLAGLRGSPAEVAGFGAACLLVASLSWIWNENAASWSFPVPLLVNVVGASAAWSMASLRSAERRRFANDALASRLDGILGRPDDADAVRKALLDAFVPGVARAAAFAPAGTVPPAGDGALWLALRAGGSDHGWLVLDGLGDDTAADLQAVADRVASSLEHGRLAAELRIAQAQLEAVLRHVDAAIVVRDGTGRTLFVNEATVRLLGVEDERALLDDGLARRLEELELRAEDGTRLSIEEHPSHRLLRGGPEGGTVVLRLGPGGERWLQNRVTRLAGGRTPLTVSISEDITAARRAEAVQRVAARVSETLSAPGPLEPALQRVAGLVVPELAGAAEIRLVGERRAAGAGRPDGPPLVTPVRAGDLELGTLTLWGRGVFGAPEPALAADLARQIGVAVLQVRVNAGRAAIAHTLSSSLLPRALPDIPGYELAARFRPAGDLDETGGDFYDAVDIADGRWAILVGDVAGKGAKAAAVTGRARATLATALALDPRAEVALHQLNRTLCEEGGESLLTLALVLLDVDRHGAEVWLAGHPHPLLRTSAGTRDVGIAGPLLGASDGAAWHRMDVAVPPGAPLLLYTDGVTDAVGPGGRWGTERLRSAAARGPREPEGLLGTIEVELDQHADRFPDDIAMLAFARTA